MAGDPTLIVASRETAVYYAPYDEANDLPDDTVDGGDAWGDPWVDVGYTDGGIQLPMEVSYADLMVDQEPDPVLTPATTRSIRLETTLAEFTPENIQLATGQGDIATVAPGVGTRGHHDLVIGSVIDETTNSWGVETTQQDGEVWRFLFRRGLPISSPSPQIAQPTTKAVTDLKIRALASVGGVALYRRVLAATS